MKGTTMSTASAGAGTEGKPPKAGGAKNHCKRFWWVHLLIFCIILAIIIPVIILVAVPKIAQSKIDAAQLHIDAIAITQSQSNFLHMAINSTITTDGSVHATVAAFNGTMWLLDYDPPFVFANLEFPQTTSDSFQEVNISQPMDIQHLNELTIFNQFLLEKPVVNVRVQGDTTVRPAGIARDYPVVFSKDVAIVGFNDFNGIAVENPSVALQTTNNFNATAHIPNPTIWTIEVGNVSFYTFFNDTLIGDSNITNMVLHPGDNVYEIHGDTQQEPIITALQQRPYCENGGVLPFQLTGNTVVNNGQTIPWLQNALNAANQSVAIKIGEAVAKLGLTIPCAP